MSRGRKANNAQLTPHIIVAILVIGLLALIFEDAIINFLYSAAISSVGKIAYIHASLFGVIFPDFLFISFCWNSRLKRAVNPVTKKIVPTMYIAIIGGLLLLANILLGNYWINYLTSFLSSLYLSWIQTSTLHMLSYTIWAFTSPIILAVIRYGIISPAGARSTLKSLSRNLLKL